MSAHHAALFTKRAGFLTFTHEVRLKHIKSVSLKVFPAFWALVMAKTRNHEIKNQNKGKNANDNYDFRLKHCFSLL
jgi:hypothetical protein